MRQEILRQLQKITPEEQAILDGQDIRQELYTSRREFVVDSKKLLEKGKLIEIRPHTRFAAFPRHRHNYVELVYMCTGHTTHIINQTERIVLEEGDLLFLNQSIYHEIYPASIEDVAVNFIILPEFFSRPISMLEPENVLWDFLVSTLSGTATQSGYLHIPAKGVVLVEDLIEGMIWTLLSGRSDTNTIQQTSMGLLLMTLSKFALPINRSDPGRREQGLVFSALQYIEAHYRSGTLAEIAQKLHQPEYYVSRLLKKHTGQNFKQLLQARKLQQAAYLLSNTPLSVDDIIVSIGYDNSSYFYRKFREHYNCSPKEYRKQKR